MKSLRFHNSDGREIQEFTPIEPGKVRLYCCGPTVYNYAHIGNLRAYLQWDILRRTLVWHGYEVTHVMNVTDVGHLTDDGDDGEDKMIRGARERGMSVWDIAKFFTDAFFADTDKLNILRPTITCKATEHIADMIALVERIEGGGFTYLSGGNVYFDTSKLPDYGRMANLEGQDLLHGARVGVDENKRNAGDFVLWFTKGKFENQAMTWDSPWGRGYPGWHLECSAMSSKYLGERIDIHTGGIDHIPVHHTNEIAQSEAAFGHHWVNFWLHNEFLIMKAGKMSKSAGSFVTLSSLEDEGFHPLDYRYFILGGHYRSQLDFSKDSLEGARSSRKALENRLLSLRRDRDRDRDQDRDAAGGETAPESKVGAEVQSRLEAFGGHLADDLMTPRALAELWGLLKDDSIPPEQRLSGALIMDNVLGLSMDLLLEGAENDGVPPELQKLLDQRTDARAAKDWAKADAIRDRLAAEGWQVVDGSEGTYLEKSR